MFLEKLFVKLSEDPMFYVGKKSLEILETILPEQVDAIANVYEIKWEQFESTLKIIEQRGKDKKERIEQELDEIEFFFDDAENNLFEALLLKDSTEFIQFLQSFAALQVLENDRGGEPKSFLGISADDVKAITPIISKYYGITSIENLTAQLEQTATPEEKHILEVEFANLPPQAKLSFVFQFLGLNLEQRRIINYAIDNIALFCLNVWQRHIYRGKLLTYLELLNNENSPDKVKAREYKPVERGKNDHFTSLSSVQTLYLFELLQKEKVILSETYLNKTKLGYGIWYLTGYTASKNQQKLGNTTYTTDDKTVTQEKLKKILALISSELQR